MIEMGMHGNTLAPPSAFVADINQSLCPFVVGIENSRWTHRYALTGEADTSHVFDTQQLHAYIPQLFGL